MKQLQCNFTTTEQSKRLLELGVPADSADCYLTRFGIDEDWEVKILNNVKYSEIVISNQEYCLPCWSVGRLMGIMLICCPLLRNDRLSYFINAADDCVSTDRLETILVAHLQSFDFSKLEEQYDYRKRKSIQTRLYCSL